MAILPDTAMSKRTFVLDPSSDRYLERAAAQLGIPKSQVVREALRLYAEQLDRLSEEERGRALAAFDRGVAKLPDRPRTEVEAELEIQEAIFPSKNAIPFGPNEARMAADLYRSVPRARGREIDLAIAACAVTWSGRALDLEPRRLRGRARSGALRPVVAQGGGQPSARQPRLAPTGR